MGTETASVALLGTSLYVVQRTCRARFGVRSSDEWHVRRLADPRSVVPEVA